MGRQGCQVSADRSLPLFLKEKRKKPSPRKEDHSAKKGNLIVQGKQSKKWERSATPRPRLLVFHEKKGGGGTKVFRKETPQVGGGGWGGTTNPVNFPLREKKKKLRPKEACFPFLGEKRSGGKKGRGLF